MPPNYRDMGKRPFAARDAAALTEDLVSGKGILRRRYTRMNDVSFLSLLFEGADAEHRRDSSQVTGRWPCRLQL